MSICHKYITNEEIKFLLNFCIINYRKILLHNAFHYRFVSIGAIKTINITNIINRYIHHKKNKYYFLANVQKFHEEKDLCLLLDLYQLARSLSPNAGT